MAQETPTLARDCPPVSIRMKPAERKRLKMAATAADMSYAEFIVFLLDEHDRRLGSMAHPLDRR